MSTPGALTLEILPGRYALWQLPPDTPLPPPGQVFSITCSGNDRSIVSLETDVPPGVRAARGYRCLRLQGNFPLDEIGILARLSAPLARSGIPLFVVSTVLTDYLLLREGDIGPARAALAAQHIMVLPGDTANGETAR
jgi:hypothetical protein